MNKKNRARRRSPAHEGQSVGQEIIEGLTSLRDALRDGVALDERFTVRTVALNLEPRNYTPAQIKTVRQKLGVSQPVFAEILAVTPKTLQGWEQGRPVPKIACRLIDLIERDPEPWFKLLRAGTTRRRAG
jgi:putative transcriptional regulator